MALEIKNQELLNEIVSTAIQAAIINCESEKTAKRWTNAIDRAVREIETNPYLDYDEEKGELLVLSPSNNIYSANGVCQCVAFQKATPCRHRAAARIWRLYTEAENKPLPPLKMAAAAASAAKYTENFLPIRTFKNTEKIGNVRI